MSQPWKSGVFDCFDDTKICLIGWCAPCYLFGENAEKIDGSNKMSMTAGYCCLSCCYLAGLILHKPRREILRQTYNLVEEPNDLLITCCCSPCALCQEAREMQARGVQPGGRITSQPR